MIQMTLASFELIEESIYYNDMTCKPYLKDIDGPSGDMQMVEFHESFTLIIQEMQ